LGGREILLGKIAKRFPVTVKLLLNTFPIRSVGKFRPKSKISISNQFEAKPRLYVRRTGGVQFLQKSECDTSRTSIKGEFFSSKPKALLVNTFSGVPFYQACKSIYEHTFWEVPKNSLPRSNIYK